MSAYAQLEAYAARGRNQAEAVARPTRLRYKVAVTGYGATRLAGDRGINFGARLLEEPSFVYGLVAEGPVGEIPLGCAVVLGWKRQGGFWTGADIGFMVESAVPLRLAFSLIFEATALRVTPTDRLR